jgi:transcriptional regulator with XRE-family HTH domain
LDTTFGELLRQLRVAAGKSVGALARHLGVSVVYVSDVERGRRGPFVMDKLYQTATFLGVDPEVLVRAATNDKGSVNLDTKDYPDSAIDLFTSLARGKRREEIYQKLLKVLTAEDEKKEP